MAEVKDDENTDLRSSIAAAFDAAEKPDKEVEAAPQEGVVAPGPPIGESPPSEPDGRVRDEKGRFAKKDDAPVQQELLKEEPSQKVPGQDSGAVKGTPAPEPAPSVPPAFAAEGIKPPQSWKPEIREKFSSLPPEVQQEAIRVDREIMRTMQESKEARDTYKRLRETYAPYEPLLRAQNVDPIQFFGTTLQTVAGLATGAPQQKAIIAANILKTYGVDISLLASALEGEATPAAAPVYQDPRVDEMYRLIQQAQAERQQMLETQARQAIGEVEGLEFYEDLREDMADLLEVSARRGVAMTPKEAYDRAQLLNPSIRKVIEQRQAAVAAGNPNGSTQRSMVAASSVRASPAAPPPSGTQDRDIRAELEAAWDAALKSR